MQLWDFSVLLSSVNFFKHSDYLLIVFQAPGVSKQCNDSLQVVLGDLLSYELYAINMIDSWAKPQAGILYGNEETVSEFNLRFQIIFPTRQKSFKIKS